MLVVNHFSFGADVPEPTIRQIGRYELIDVLGQGGMGIVYRAVDSSIGRTVAIKMLRGASADDQDLLARFYREVRSTAHLQHRNIVTVHDLGDFEGFPYMVMEYLEGQSMAQMIASTRTVPLVEKIGLVIQVCEGLQYAHERNVIHRDIKPANILVLKDGVAKIVDFGIARMERSETITKTGQLIGSMSYMSPEQISDIPIDTRSDIFSVGVMLFQFLTGELPFKAADPNATFMKILNDPVPSLGNYIDQYPPELDEILGRAMAKKTADRYQTAEELCFDLTHLQETLKRGMTEGFLEQAESAMARKDWEAARQNLQEILKLDRQNTRASEMMHAVRQELQKQQRSAQIQQLRSQAQIALAGAQYEEAFECLDQACRLDPKDSELIALRQTIGSQAKRAQALREALRRGQAALYAGDLKDAERAVSEALQLEPAHTEARALDDLIRKELAERSRQAQLHGFLEEARREISSKNFVSALKSLQKAQQIDPSDSNIRELFTWAARGHEQEKRRKELEQAINEASQLMHGENYLAALESCDNALQRFPDDASLTKLRELADRQNNLSLRRRFVEERRAEATRLADAGDSKKAAEVLEAALQEVPGDPTSEMLLSMIRAESDRREAELEEQERRRRESQSSQIPHQEADESRRAILDTLQPLRKSLAEHQPMATLIPLVERLKSALKEHGTGTDVGGEGKRVLIDFESRHAKWIRDAAELEQLRKSIRAANSIAEMQPIVTLARFLSEAYGKDVIFDSLCAEIVAFAVDTRTRRDDALNRASQLLTSMQSMCDMSSLVSSERRIQEIAAEWPGELSIGDLSEQATAQRQQIQESRQRVLSELAQLRRSLPGARSHGQITLQLEQARLLAAECEGDAEVAKELNAVQDKASEILEELHRACTQLKELALAISASTSIVESENRLSSAKDIASRFEGFEEIDDLVRKAIRRFDERKRDHERIRRNVESLIASAQTATGEAQLDMILARHRDLVKSAQGEETFSSLAVHLDSAVESRRAQLIEGAADAELDESTSDFDGQLDENLLATEIAKAGKVSTQTRSRVPTNEPKPTKRKFRAIGFGAAVLGFTAVVGAAAYLLNPKAVRLHTSPETARITLDGEPCPTPCSARLKRGNHHVDGSLSGYEDLHQQIDVPLLGGDISLPPMKQTVIIVPEQAKQLSGEVQKPIDNASIRVKSVPGSTVILDGAPVGKISRNGEYLIATSVGSHQLEVENPDFKPIPSRRVQASKNATAVQFVKLEANPPGVRSVTAPTPVATVSPTPAPFIPTAAPVEPFLVLQAPANSEIHIDQQMVGHSTGGPFKSRVQPGQRTVEVFLQGFQPWTQTVTIEAGKDANLIAKLTPLPAPATPTVIPDVRPSSAVSEADCRQIQQLLDRYADGYGQKNVKAIQAVWPSIPSDTARTVKAFFKEAGSISMKIKLTDASPAGKRVTVECLQTLSYALDGKQSTHTVAKTVYVVKSDRGWLIDFVPTSD